MINALKVLLLFSFFILALKYFSVFPFDNRSYTIAMQYQVNSLCHCTSNSCYEDQWKVVQELKSKINSDKLSTSDQVAVDRIILEGNTCIAQFESRATKHAYTFKGD